MEDMKPAEETEKECAGASGGNERDVTEATRRTCLTKFSESFGKVRREDGEASVGTLVKVSNSASVTNNPNISRA